MAGLSDSERRRRAACEAVVGRDAVVTDPSELLVYRPHPIEERGLAQRL